MTSPAIYGPLAIALSLASPVLAEYGDAARGKECFAIRCIECHAISKTNDKKIGPSLKGLICRTCGSMENHEYSYAMKGARIL
jgi:cytochrome c